MINLRTFPSFPLRSDFAVEIGYFTELHEPISEEEFRRFCAAAGRPFSTDALMQRNRHRCCYPKPPDTYFGGMITPGGTDPVPFVTDGRYCSLPRLPGLFWDALERARIAAGYVPCPLPFTFPRPREKPGPDFVLPETVILHSPIRSTAYVVPIEEADEVVRSMNGKCWKGPDATASCDS